MFRLGKKMLFVLLIFLLINMGIALWLFIFDLKTRFPEMDFSHARFGIASWYSETDKHINEKTASGEKFDDQGMTCASWDYPFGEKLIIINALNARWTVCRVNDRGPAKRLGRQIDLTKTVFSKIANPRHGLIYVSIIPAQKEKSGRH